MNPRIPLSAPDITEAEIAAVTAVLRTPHLSLGPELPAFEAALAQYHGVPHAVAVSSGTAGLHLSLLALGIGPGDEVILPSFTFIAVANAVLQVGATPVLVDIDPVTLNLDPARVEEAVSSRARAIIVVHTFGIPAEMDALGSIARRHGLAIIEDACEAIGATFDGRKVGTFGDLAVFGFYPNKQMTTGEGGAVLARDDAHAARLRTLRNQGRSGKGWHGFQEPGYNYRLSDIACALGRVQLNRLDEMLALRRAVAERYNHLLAEIPGLEPPPLTLPMREISWFVYVVRLPDSVDRERLQMSVEERATPVSTSCYFPPIHLQDAWRDSCRIANPLSVTEQVARRTLALPFFNRITHAQQSEVHTALVTSLVPGYTRRIH
jgi:perosamine synthetase